MHRRTSLPWPGADENTIINSMLADPDSLHWSKCYELVVNLTQFWAGDLSVENQQEVIQNAMLRVMIYLPTFKRQCKLSTWLIKIVRSCRADELRKAYSTRSTQTTSLDVSARHDDDDTEINEPPAPMTAEEEFLVREELDEIKEALLNYLAEHGKRERNSNILDLHLDGLKQQEIAKELGIPAPVVGYVIRSIQRFAREHRQHQPPPPSSPR